MIEPVAARRRLPFKTAQFPDHEIAERLASHVDIAPVAIDKIHRHIERIIDILFKAEAAFKDERDHAGPRSVRIRPEMRAVGNKAVGLSFRERRIGENGEPPRSTRPSNDHQYTDTKRAK